MKLGAALAVCALLAAMPAAAQISPNPQAAPRAAVGTSPLPAGPALTWNAVPGQAVEFGIDAVGRVFALSREGDIWRWRPDQGRWGHVSGKMARIAVGAGGRPWGIDADGNVHRSTGLWWDKVAEGGADLAADMNENVWMARKDGSIQKWNPLRSEWEKFSGTARRLAAGDDQRLWAILPNGGIARWDGKQWSDIPGSAQEIAVGPEGTVFMISPERTLMRWDEAGKKWHLMDAPAGLVALAVGPQGKPWIATDQGILAADLFVPEQRQERAERDKTAGVTAKDSRGSGDLKKITSEDPIVFTDTRSTGVDVAIGADGTVFGLDQSGKVFRWNATLRAFQEFPGTLTRLAVNPVGLPWGINDLGQIFRHDGRDWRTVDGGAVDIAIGGDGSVLIARSDETLHRYDPERNAFVRVPGSGAQVAVDPQGRPWTIRKDGSVLRCDGESCRTVPLKAKSIAIGPDGSVFTTSAENRLRRWNERSGNWDEIVIPAHDAAQVAVGPRGRPWVVAGSGKILASFFPTPAVSLVAQTSNGVTMITAPTDTVATTTSTTTAANGFVFRKNIQFEAKSLPETNIVSYNISAGQDGTVMMFGNLTVQLYKDKKGVFQDWSYGWPAPFHWFDFQVFDADSRLWLLSENAIYQQISATSTSYRTYALPQRNAIDVGMQNMAIAPDGTVFAMNKGGELVYKSPDMQAFRFFIPYTNGIRVAVARTNDLWIIDDIGKVRQWNGSVFEDRHQSATEIAAGREGSVYISDGSYLRKWNATNRRFDQTEQEAEYVAVQPDGRPWVHNFPYNNVLRAK